MANASLPLLSFLTGLSCGNLIFPSRYNDNPMPTNIQIPINTSLFNKPQCITRSAFDKNLIANPTSIKPKTTFTEFNHPPDLGNEFNQLGNKANKANGNASARPKPPIPTVNCTAPPVNDPTNNEPKIGPVQEKETMANVSAIKKIPIIFPVPALASALPEKLLGNVISNNPKKDSEKMINTAKKVTLSQGFVETEFNISGLALSKK